jgi:Zn-dependent protease with chaperone function
MTKTARTSVIFSVFGLLFAGLCLKYYFTSAKLAIPPIYLGTSYLVCSFPSLHLLSLSVVGFFSFGTATIKLALVNFLIRLSVLAVVFITAIVVRLIVKLANSNALRNINRFAGVLIITTCVRDW